MLAARIVAVLFVLCCAAILFYDTYYIDGDGNEYGSTKIRYSHGEPWRMEQTYEEAAKAVVTFPPRAFASMQRTVSLLEVAWTAAR